LDEAVVGVVHVLGMNSKLDLQVLVVCVKGLDLVDDFYKQINVDK
jgi:hypothetical protein